MSETQKDKPITAQEITMLRGVLEAYSNYHLSGGSLHIVLEDGNISLSDFTYCKEYAFKQHDYVGAYIAEMFEKMPEHIIQHAKDIDFDTSLLIWENESPLR